MNRTDLNVASGQDADRQEQTWESEGGALAGWSDAGVAVDPSPRPVSVQRVDASIDLGGNRPMTGTITDLRPGGFGFIASNAYGMPWHLSFRRTAIDDDGFVQLHVGQRVRFDQEAIPGGRGQHAVGVVPLD
jgi:cold shock CspA family protein